MKFVLCDEDQLIRSMVEGIVVKHGHDVIGVADDTATATLLIHHARPDAVICDFSLGYNTDFDVIDAAISVGAQPIVFSQNTNQALLERYPVRPVVVAKPDLTMLEHTVERLVRDDGRVVQSDRRRRPARTTAGPAPTGPSDAHAFYEALHGAAPEDALLSVDLAVDSQAALESIGNRVSDIIRDTDRLLTAPSGLKVFLAGAGRQGVEAVLQRLGAAIALTGTIVRSVVIGDGESPTDAFERLKRAGDVHDTQ